MALLTAGQFDHAYKELRNWMDSVSATLDEVEPVYGDPKMVEIELAKLRVGTRWWWRWHSLSFAEPYRAQGPSCNCACYLLVSPQFCSAPCYRDIKQAPTAQTELAGIQRCKCMEFNFKIKGLFVFSWRAWPLVFNSDKHFACNMKIKVDRSFRNSWHSHCLERSESRHDPQIDDTDYLSPCE